MRPTDAYETFAQTYSYPVDSTTVIETMGETTIESPTGDDATIAETFAHADDREFASARELGDAFFSYLPEQYIGRKYYDDRGDNPHPSDARSSTDIETDTSTETDTDDDPGTGSDSGTTTRTGTASD